jgi:hypothetical protein
VSAAHKPEQMPRHLAHLNLFGTFGDAVAAVVAVNMFKWPVARIAHAAVDLHREIGCVAAQAIRFVIAHADLVRQANGDFGFGHHVHLRRRLVDQQPEHFSLGLQLNQRKLDRLIGGERLAKGLALLGISNRFIDAILCRAERRCRLPNAVFMNEMLRDREARIKLAKNGAFGHPHAVIFDLGMVGGHVERPQIIANLKSRRVSRHDEAGNPARFAIFARCPRKGHHMAGGVDARDPHLIAINPVARNAAAHLGHRDRIHMRCIAAMMFFGQAKAPPHLALKHWRDEIGLLLGRTKIAEHQHLHEIADDARFVLQIIVQPQSPVREVMADRGHGEVRPILAAKFLRDGKAVMPRFIRHTTHLTQQRPPDLIGQSLAIPISPRILTAMIEEADIVVTRLNRLDFSFNEGIEFMQVGYNISRDFKQHPHSPFALWFWAKACQTWQRLGWDESKEMAMDRARMMWIGLAVLVAVPVLAQTGAITPPAAKPSEPPNPGTPALPADPAKPAEKKADASKAAIAAQAMIDGALKKIDRTIKRETNVWQFAVGKRQVIVITDPIAERMRIMVPIGDATLLDQDLLKRLMQANFDSALDARYAIANDVLWGTFIHPLVSLDEPGFVSGLAQALAVADNFGGSYSSGAIVFGGGDSTKIQAQDLLEQLKKRAEDEKKNVT